MKNPTFVNLELHRDVDQIVTAEGVRIECRHCGDWVIGPYASAEQGHRVHMEIVHPDL